MTVALAWAVAISAPTARAHERDPLPATWVERPLAVPRGWTVLEASRSHGIPHTSVCGGRARCSTCRVRVTAGLAACEPPGEDEARTLELLHEAVTVLQANAVMDGGDIWATRSFSMRAARKSSLYRNEVTEAATAAVLEAVEI